MYSKTQGSRHPLGGGEIREAPTKQWAHARRKHGLMAAKVQDIAARRPHPDSPADKSEQPEARPGNNMRPTATTAKYHPSTYTRTHVLSCVVAKGTRTAKKQKRCLGHIVTNATRHHRCGVRARFTINGSPTEGVEVRVRQKKNGLESLHSLELLAFSLTRGRGGGGEIRKSARTHDKKRAKIADR